MLTLFLVPLLGIYLALLIVNTLGWRRLTHPTPPTTYTPSTRVTVVVPARNEAHQIARTLQAILSQQYPAHLLQIIVADDHSTDNTPHIVQSFAPSVQLIQLANYTTQTTAYKKAAIQLAISHSTAELIVCTDADCTMGTQWLHTLVHYYEQYRPHIIAAPVRFSPNHTYFQRFQALDFAGLMIATGGGIATRTAYSCNGANLAYTRDIFYEVGGYHAVDQLASGDDVFLLHKIAAKYPHKVAFLKAPQAIVHTQPCTSWQQFWQQRIRWATKTTAYARPSLTFIWAAVWLLNISIALLFLAAIYNPHYALLAASLLAAKSIADYLYLRQAARFFDLQTSLTPLAFLYALLAEWLYICTIGILANFQKQYRWKDRTTR